MSRHNGTDNLAAASPLLDDSMAVLCCLDTTFVSVILLSPAFLRTDSILATETDGSSPGRPIKRNRSLGSPVDSSECSCRKIW